MIDRTLIYKQTNYGETLIGYIDPDQIIYRAFSPSRATPIGRVSADQRIYLQTQYQERELGYYTQEGEIHSHGLFEGGTLGWVEQDGVVIQGGLIFEEKEVGRIDGEMQAAGAAALLLLFLPQDAEENRRFG